MSLAQLKLIPRPSISAQARLAIARYRAERSGSRPLSEAEVARIDELTTVESVNGELTIDHYLDWKRQFSWQNIFDSKLPMNREGVARQAKDSGYRFFAFEGEVDFVSCKGIVEYAGLSVSEIHTGD